ncbi:hypothetical protein Dda3937_00026 [Dickeya dadantii 3937]|uniref:Uncharacterized protein n=1 Tax=Dickeya dadantii (strain 3937) TaxID=198628 RepID=E0SHS6_DICD3|nr:hypothetical protein Dda3937_00026 [Dickeya dadantii 3937]
MLYPYCGYSIREPELLLPGNALAFQQLTKFFDFLRRQRLLHDLFRILAINDLCLISVMGMVFDIKTFQQTSTDLSTDRDLVFQRSSFDLFFQIQRDFQ